MKRSPDNIPDINSVLAPQYLVDEKGKKTKIVIDLPIFEKFIEDIEDFYFGMMAQKVMETETEFLTTEELEKALGLDEEK